VSEAGAPDSGWPFPDTLIGTDSHTPMVNGLGVLGWGVGGLEAEGVMFGIPATLRIPEVIGVRLSGRLREGVLATDLALVVTHRLRAHGLASQFVEFFGEGLAALSVGERAVVANMAPEYGAQTAYFPVDAQSLAYLRATGRSEAQIETVEAYCRQVGLWLDPSQEVRFTDVVEIDLGTIGTSIAGPQRPHDLLAPKDAPAAAAALVRNRAARRGDFANGAIAIAAVTSCTNTTDPRLNIAAGLLARKARALGLQPKPWVKTSFSPGSPAAARYLERAGLLADLDASASASSASGA
jgi:aconitate hydratase